MTADDQREYRDFYGIQMNDWQFSFGSFANEHYFLKNDYISDGVDCDEASEASITHYFIYEHHIKKTYFIEGVAEGNICLTASDATSTITAYRATICKMNEDTTDTELKSTGWITVNDILAWDAGLGVGDEIVYHYSIDIWEHQTLDEHDRLYLKIEVQCDQYGYLMHSNDSQWKDVWISIPFRM